MHQQKTWENTTPSRRCESFHPVLDGALVLPPPWPPQASAKAVDLTDDSSWQNSAHPRKRGTFASREVNVRQASGSPLISNAPWPHWKCLGGQQRAKAACSTGFHQTLSWMNREGCASSDTKTYITFSDWASFLMDLANTESTVIGLYVFYSQPCYKTRDIPSSAWCSASFSRAHLAKHMCLRVTNPLLQL